MNGVSRNNNIDGLIFVGWDVLNGSVFPYMTPWLRSNNNLTMLQIVRCNGMGGDGLHLLAAALVSCTSLEHIAIRNCSIEDDNESFQEVINALNKNNHTCNQLDVSENNIGRKVCDALATMLSNPLCELKTLTLSHNNIDDEGVAYLAQGLANNDRLETMDVAKGNPMITNQGWTSLSKILCNGKSINDTFLSNHRLKHLGQRRQRDDLALYLSLNRAISDNAIVDPFIPIQKIILCHRNDWDMKPYIDEDLTLLPYILHWIESAGVLNTNFSGINNRQKRQYRRTLQSFTNMTLHQFVRAFPIVVVDKLRSTQLTS